MTDNPKVFISYASPDQERVLPYYEFLIRNGFNVWMDCKELHPGQNWDYEIKRAFSSAKFIVLFLSENMVDRRGYIQRELRLALDKRMESLIDDIYIIPVLLDRIDVPEQIKDIQYVDATEPTCKQRIAGALNFQLKRMGLVKIENNVDKEISWSKENFREVWDGIPGYEIDAEFVKLSSNEYNSVHEVGEFIRGYLLRLIFSYRAYKLQQDSNLFNLVQKKWSRTNTLAAYCQDPVITGRIISICYNIYAYGAGAAHPNSTIKCFNFHLNPLVPINDPDDIFLDPDEAFPVIQNIVRKNIRPLRLDGETVAVDAEDNGSQYQSEDWINSGTRDWDCYSIFTFLDGKIRFLFPPYQVGPYAEGPYYSDVPILDIKAIIKNDLLYALNMWY
ncbi:TIR domain-containing protein [Azospirillum sp. BE72]|uniref:TIR domain-containing protein n=1 Tax=Azospirillum sp. BE72 TaxID=2817776 RepID=UPI002860245A|nr:TIR domain-containing protein [Azospirillum sp. BE72]MDR6769346.1 hypothetical protein [Azospirillum sp. BE72]